MKKRFNRKQIIKYVLISISLIIIYLGYSYLASVINFNHDSDDWVGNCVQVATYMVTGFLTPEQNISLKEITYEQNPFDFAGFTSQKSMIRYLEKKNIPTTFYLNATVTDIKDAIDEGDLPTPIILSSNKSDAFSFLNAEAHFVTIVDYSIENKTLTGFYLFDSYFWLGNEHTNWTTPYYMNIKEFERLWARPITGHIGWINIEPISNAIQFVHPLIIAGKKEETNANWKIKTITNLMYGSEKIIVFFAHTIRGISKIIPYINFR